MLILKIEIKIKIVYALGWCWILAGFPFVHFLISCFMKMSQIKSLVFGLAFLGAMSFGVMFPMPKEVWAVTVVKNGIVVNWKMSFVKIGLGEHGRIQLK
ncbi:hypothetical protein [Algoriphagus namhaensis]